MNTESNHPPENTPTTASDFSKSPPSTAFTEMKFDNPFKT